jgi:hypothetical protein
MDMNNDEEDAVMVVVVGFHGSIEKAEAKESFQRPIIIIMVMMNIILCVIIRRNILMFRGGRRGSGMT